MRASFSGRARAERAIRQTSGARDRPPDVNRQARANVATLLVFVDPTRVDRFLSLLKLGGASSILGPFIGDADIGGEAPRPFALTDAPTRKSDGPRRERYTFGQVTVDVAAYEVMRTGTPIALSALEFDLLVTMARALGAVVPTPTLQRMIPASAACPDSHSLRAHIANLRRKLEHDSKRPRYLINIRRRGYRLAGVRRED